MNHITHIAIDGNEANVKNRVGSNIYAFEILKSLHRLTARDRKIKITVLLSDKKLNDLPRERQSWKYQVITPKKLWTQWALPLHLYQNKNNYNVFFTPGHYAPRICPVPYISSVMDLGFVKYPKQFKKSDLIQLKNWTKYSVKNANKIITISNFTKQELIKHYGLRSEKIIIAYPAANKKSFKITKNKEAHIFDIFGLSQNYLLNLSTLQPRKNIIRVIEAFEKISIQIASQSINLKRRGQKSKFSQISDLQLVIAGKIGWMAKDILAKVENSPFKDKIILTGFVNDLEKAILLKNSLGSISAGFYEGFGIPPLEAMQWGSVPLVANNSSMGEVVGKAGLYFNPFKTEEIIAAMTELISLSPKQRAILTKKGREQLKKFSWDKSARIILDELCKLS